MSGAANKALQDFNASISQYGNIESSVNNYVTQKQNEVYDTWKEDTLSKLGIDQQKKQQLDELIGVSGATWESGMSLYNKYKKGKAVKKASGQSSDDTTGKSSTGANEGDDIAGGAADKSVKPAENPSGTQAVDEPEEDEAKERDSGGDGGEDIEMTEISPEARAAAAVEEVEEPTSAVIGGGETASTLNPLSKGTIAVDDVTSPVQKGTIAVDEAEDATTSVAKKVGGDALKTGLKAVGEGAGEEAASGFASGALAVAGTALDVLGPVGMAVGLGLTLADLFGHHKKAPPAPASVETPYIATAMNTSAGVVLPSESAAIDMVGGHSAF